ncbi:MAG: HD domain-containing protein [Candidatus Moranbacteria bacterium]|jgi:uncharacterized protein|nr:HD domain-containing protein [Candidatus Moranbacteria bacterium]
MMDNIEKIKEIVKKELAFCSAHNFEHVMRVYNMAVRLAENEDVDIEVVKMASLLHDIGGAREINDPSGKTDHALESAKMAKPILEELGYSEDKIKHILDCIISHRYRTENKPKTKEAQIVFDADKLETVGAIGVARAFTWIGRNNANIYRKVDIEEYAKENLGGKINGRIQDKTKHSPQIQWETKDKFILDYLYTDKAQEIAKERMEFSKMFLERLEKEINNEL